ncbi:Ca2+-binding RTX toxin-like protein [Kribbella pratensis]|uniref:Ca2+-binding RTX toxin-like protein n=1 Tax=Kribbella pratensis TaxID=2512112 RepID=A0ABY2FAH6_9ACTN|nr:calcium-binding protein [Kribbella pratensis]TDW87430.1 Ca2+-binding RTX toxin-like protein [Kribbella pratensis]
MRTRQGRRAVAAVTTLVLGTSVLVAPPASAGPLADPAVDGIRAALTGGPGARGLEDLVTDLATVGAFGKQLNGLTLEPGSDAAIGLRNLLQGGLGEVDGYAGAASVGALVDAFNATDSDYATDSGPKRHVKWTAAQLPDDSITRVKLTALVTRTVTTGIRVSSKTKPFDFTSASGLQATLTFTATFVVNYDDTAKSSWLDADPAVTLRVNGVQLVKPAPPNAEGTLPAVDAAIGILGVTLKDTSTYAEDVTIKATIRDPNNDGRLSVGQQNSELGAQGAAAGLTTVALVPGGSLSGVLHIVPRPSSAITGLPGVEVDVTVGPSDPAAGEPAVEYPDHELDPVAAFEMLTPFDLAQGVNQLISTLTKLQHARPTGSTVDVDLPFLHGTVADVVPATEALQQFLIDHVTKPSTPGATGVPDFASVQQFLEKLAGQSNSVYTVAISGAAFSATDPLHPRLEFTIGVQRKPSDQPADPVADLLSGGPDGVTYGPTQLTDSSKDWNALRTKDPAFVDGLTGRQITVGSHTAAIKSVGGADKHAIVLDPAPLGTPVPASWWTGGTPTNGDGKTGYSIAAGNSKAGNVELANVLKDKSHLRDANAVRPQATITSDYNLTLPVVLDLQPAATLDACKPLNTDGKACPYVEKTGADGNGPQRVVTELPVRADRIMLATGGQILTASTKLRTPVDLTAAVGYVPVRIGGTIALCPTTGYDAACAKTGTPGPIQQLTLKGTGTPVPVGQLFDGARDNPDQVLTGLPAATIARAHGDLKLLDVAGTTTYFHDDGTPGVATLDADVASTPATPTVTDAAGDLAKLVPLDVKPDAKDAYANALFGILLADLSALSTQMSTAPAAGGLDTQIPLLGTSFGQLMVDRERGTAAYAIDAGFLELTDATRTFDANRYVGRRVFVGSAQFPVAGVTPDGHTLKLAAPPAAAPATGTEYRIGDELLWAVDALTALQPPDLGALLADLEKRLGNGSDVSFTVDTATKILHLTIDWKRAFHTRAPASLHVTLPGSGAVDLSGNTVGGALDIDASGETVAKLNIPLDEAGLAGPATELTIDPSSTVSARAKVSTPPAQLTGSVGALPVDLGNAGDDTGLQVAGDLALAAKGPAGPLGAWWTGLSATTLNGGTAAQTCTGVSSSEPMSLCARIPLHKHGDAAVLDTMTLRLPQSASSPAEALALTPDFGGGPRLSALPGLDAALAANTISLKPLADGLTKYLDNSKSALDLASAGGKVPLIGKDLQAGKDFLGQLQKSLSDGVNGVGGYTTFAELKTALQNAFAAEPLKSLTKGPVGVTGECSGGPCAGPETASEIQSVTLNANFGSTGKVGDDGCADDGSDVCPTADLPLDLGLPGLALHAKKNDDGSIAKGIQAKVGWKLNLTITLDKTKGVLLETAPKDELQVGAAIKLPAELDAQLAFLQVKLTNNKPGASQLAALFSIDLQGGPGGHLPLASLLGSNPASLFHPSLKAKLDLDIGVDTGLAGDTTRLLPGLTATFKFAAAWNGSAPDQIGISTLEFDDVTVDPGAFLSSTIKPIVDDIVSTLKPVQPILDTITAPIPVLSDLSHLAGGGDVTILTLAQAFGSGYQSVKTVTDIITTVKRLSDALQSLSSAGGIKLGSFKLLGDKVQNTATSPASADGLIGEVKDKDGAVIGNGKPASIIGDLNKSLDPDKAQLSDKDSGPGITFPALKDPRQLFSLIAGGDATLAQFDSSTLSVNFSMSESFGPVYAPPPVLVVISGSASVSLHVVAGFDTYGIRQAVETGKPVQILNSLFFVTVDEKGAPIPVITFRGELAAGAEVSAVIIKAGVVGGIALTVNFTWNDPNNDGKFRFSEFLATALKNPICLFNVGGELSLFLKVFITIGFSPFSVSFDFTLVNIKLLDFSISPNCTPPPPRLGGTKDGVLYLFAGKLGTGTARGDDLWNAGNADETWVVRQAGTTMTVQALGITQTFGGITTVVLDGRKYGGQLKVLLQGKDANTDFTAKAIVYGGSNADVIRTGSGPAFVDGGGGDDTITTGDRPKLGNAAVPGVVVAGNGGADRITVGNDIDVVAGDGHLSAAKTSLALASPATGKGQVDPVPFADVVDVAAVQSAKLAEKVTPSESEAGNDTVVLGLGKSEAYGGAGDDNLAVAADSPLLGTPGQDPKGLSSAGVLMVGGAGADSVSGGSGNDTIYTGDVPSAHDQDNAGAGDKYDPNDPLNKKEATEDPHVRHTDVNHVDTGKGTDWVWGSNSTDFVIGHSATGTVDHLFGLGGNDVLVGADGADEIYGGRGDDYVIAQPSSVDTGNTVTDQLGAGAYRVTPLPDPNPASKKTLVGGGGRDRIYGGDGESTIYGDHSTIPGTATPDTCASPGPDPSDPPAEHPRDAGNETDPANYDDADLILGGNGVDTVQAGGGNDWAFTAGSGDLVCAEGGDDHAYGGSGPDTVLGGSGNDVLQGDSEDDHLYGNLGNDTAYGNGGADHVQGNAGADTLFGGEDNDVLIGGTTTAGRNDAAATPAGESAARGDIIRGDIGTDKIIGDNGDPSATSGPVFDLGSSDASRGGPDTVYGGTDDDTLFGGLDDDQVFGGTGNDDAEGNPGADHVYGEAGADDLIGGSHQTPGDPAAKHAAGYPDTGDAISGGGNDDVIAGDNASITDTVGPDSGDPVTRGRGLSFGRHVVLFDLGYSPAAANSGADAVDGGAENDVVYGQDGGDTIHGAAGNDYAEGDQAADFVYGDAGQDDLAGGSSYVESGSGQATAGQLDSGDTISGGDDADVVLGDNGLLTRDAGIAKSPITQGRANTDAAGQMAERSIQPYDLGDSPVANTSGGDDVTGDGGCDAILGQGGNDRLKGNDDADYSEGGPGRDWVEGNAGSDDLIGGSSTIFGADTANTTQGQPDVSDAVFGGLGDDVITGDNAVTTRVGTPSPYLLRVGSDGRFEAQRSLRLLDLSWSNGFLGAPTRAVAGGDQLSGGGGVDVAFGQDGDDAISGGAGDDYAEGNGGHDTEYGDRTLAEAGIAIPGAVPAWPGSASGPAALGDLGAPHGQDDLIGGSSLATFRDTGDDVHGDGAADFVLGDNGTAVRDVVDQTGKPVALGDDLATVSLPLTNRIYTGRYNPSQIPADAAYVRHGVGGASTRFCTTAQATCEAAGASGNDQLWGGIGEDTMYGQDGDDLMYGDTGSTAGAGDGGTLSAGARNDDDMYGELGNDRLWGESGEDAMLGDRGGVVDTFQNGSNHFVVDQNQVPQIHYEGFLAGSVTRKVDLQHDVNGDVFAASGTATAMPHRGDLEGGDDRLRGGDDHDSVHGGFGDDLANGDSGGDIVFGDDGADLLWGGKGCDASVDAATPDCRTSGVFDPNARGTNDRMVDYLLGGKGATSGPSVTPDTGALGSDIIDWHPRGTYGVPGSTTCTANPWPQTFGNGKNAVTVDPCSWFEMTNLTDAGVADNQHHQGIDWMYGGWDRDVLQGDVADNGPNLGDRMLDWTGAYNLYTHCNAAYGGYNDVRQWSPSMQDFLQRWAGSLGAGQITTDVTTAGTSAYDELALVYQADLQVHGSGPAFPSTPGHFDDPNACAP